MRALKAVLKVLLGLSLGLVLAEGAFSWRDAGAFPHLNLYEVDPVLGVRLEPNASMKLRVATNGVTTMQTNSLGYRGPQWPKASATDVLVVGDSQVFGLGVEANETFSAKLSELLKVNVLNGGVPTYGPREYTAVVKEVLARQKVSTVVYVLNLSNDLFEVERPNLQRHTVWDGWAVRSETAPASVTRFPFRHALMSRSHLVFAARKWLHSGEAATEGFATEGTWKDVVQASTGVQPLPPEDVAARQLLEARSALGAQLDAVADKLGSHFQARMSDPEFAAAAKPITPKEGDPRDIIAVVATEGARRVDRTGHHLLLASLGEGRNEAFLQALAKSRNDPELQKLVEERKALRAKLDALAPDGEPAHVAPIERVLLETKAACDAAGAKLIVVALPLDVMVSADEWKKYGVPPLDMSPTKVLVEDVISRAERVGAMGVDPTASLAAAEPGAFLEGDLHMTPKGHAALARAIAEAMQRPPRPKGALALPEGRSWMPTEDEWRREKEVKIEGTEDRCEARRVREWLRVRCPDVGFANIAVVKGGHGDARAFRNDGALLVIPVVESDAAKVLFSWWTTSRELSIEFPKGGALTLAFTEAVPREEQPADERLRYSGKTEIVPLEVPACEDGMHVAGAMRLCRKPCDAKTPCAQGHCEPWPSGDFCAVP